MNNSIRFIFLVIAVCVGIAIYHHFPFNKSSAAASYRIALFAPAVHPAMNDIMQGFKDTIQKNGQKTYAFDIYNANNNKTLLRAQADEIIQGRYDLVFSIGTGCAHTLYELGMKRGDPVPHVFSAIDDPVRIGLVKSLTSSGNHMTGVQTTSPYEQQIDILLKVRPDVKTITLVYNPHDGSSRQQEVVRLQHIVQARNIIFKTIEVMASHEIVQKVQPFMDETDVIMMLTDHTVVSGIDGLITLCNRYHVTLYASDLNSGDKGAALAFGVLEYDYGVQGAQLALNILEEKQKPSELAVALMDTCYLKINTRTAAMQGLNLGEKALEQFKAEGAIVV